MINNKLKIIRCHVLIIGGGAAGIRAGLEAIKYGDTVILSKTIVGKDGCSVMAEGGFNAVLRAKCIFRSKSINHSDSNRSVIPVQIDQPFRFKSINDSSSNRSKISIQNDL